MAKRPTPADALRTAVDQTFQAAAGQAQLTRGRAQELVDELGHTAGRLRGALDELRPPSVEETRALATALAALEKRVATLERELRSPTNAATRRGAARKSSGR